jgi:type IV pilus assembly protein PilY1
MLTALNRWGTTVMKPAKRFLPVLALAAAIGPLAQADDTDIYLDPVQPTGSEPLVMFTLDYRANMNAVQCSNFVNVPSNGVDGIKETCDFSDELSQQLFDQGAGVEGFVDDSGPIKITTKITLYELVRAVLALVLEDVSGVKVGIMMPHEDTTGGGGCDPGDAECSSGAMVMMGFQTLLDGDSNGAKQLFKDTLRSIPATSIPNLPDYHPYQLKEMYFELFRYLTGQKIVYGHQGWRDFDDDNAAKTVNLDGPEAMHPIHQVEIGQGDTEKSEGEVLNPGSTTTVINLDGVSAVKENTTPDIFVDMVLRILSGPAAGEERAITAYPGGPARQATVSPAFSAAPGSGEKYEVVERHYPQWDASIEDGAGNYISPLTDSDCAKLFVINVGFGTANGDNDLDAFIQGGKSGGAPDGSGGMGITLKGSNTQAQVVRFMNDADLGDGTWGTVGDLDGNQNVVSYFIMQSANLTQHQWASAGGTGNAIELGTDPDTLIETLQNIFKSILSVSTTFVAPSVPVNVFNRAQIVNEVFLALFEADEAGLPFWNGNLKKVVIGENAVTGEQEIQDANGNQAIDVDGRLRRDAVTFWTETATLPDPPGEDEVDGADGRAITRGGAGQHIAGSSGNPQCFNNDIVAGGRNLYTEDPGENLSDSDSNDDLMPLNCFFANLDEIWTDLTASYDPPPPTRVPGSDDETEAILDYFFLRGLEADGSTPRQWMLGDPLHSRPRPINYGARPGFSETNPDIRIVMGSNDGYMHMFQNTDSSSSDTGVPDTEQPGQSGIENWAYIPRASLKTINRLQTNVADIPVHPNTTDGSPVVLFDDADNSGTIGDDTDDRVVIYFGMRRGGANLYALDVTDPDDPKFLWRIIGGSGEFAELTQTWSTPQIGRVRLSGVDTDVLVFGGGYNGDDDGNLTYELCDAITAGVDNNEFDDKDGIDEDDRTECFDSLGKDLANRIQAFNKANDPNVTQQVGTDDPHGNAIYIVNALTGELIWKAAKDGSLGSPTFDGTKTLGVPDLNDSFPAEITAVDTTGNGILDRILAADTGGNVWRIDLGDFVDTNLDGDDDTLVIDDISKWQIVRLLNAGRGFTSDVTNDRRFFNRVDIAQTRDDSGPFDAVLVGSGDRENPLEVDVENWFYMIKDRQISVGAPPTTTLNHDDLVDLSDNCLQTGTEESCLTATEQSQFEDGWRIQLEAASGEKNLAAAVTSGGNVFFTTFAPEPVSATCGLSEGVGRFYALSLSDATAIINFDTSNDTDGTTYERFDTLGSGGIPVEVVPLGQGQILVQGQEVGQNIVATGGRTGFRTYWYELPEL